MIEKINAIFARASEDQQEIVLSFIEGYLKGLKEGGGEDAGEAEKAFPSCR